MDGNGSNHNFHNQHLRVNKLGRNIRKSPPLHHHHHHHHPSSARPSPPQPPPPSNQPPQPLVYNISKNEFRSIVQQLTGTPSREPSISSNPLPPPPPSINRHLNPTATATATTSNRLHRIRPPPLAPIARPALPSQPPPNPNPSGTFRLPSPLFTPSPLSNPLWAAASESPISAYMRHLENFINPSSQPPPPQQPGLLPTPPPNTALQPQQQGLPTTPLPSPSSFLNLLSPLSPHLPLLSPNFQFPPPLSPGLLGSPFGNGGILGPGPSQPPLSPSSFLQSPKWRNMQ